MSKIMNQKWEVIYYIDSSSQNPVADFIDNLNTAQQAKILRILMYVEEYGLQSIIPHVKKLSKTPFWEIRVLGKDNIRIIFLTVLEQKVLLLHGFIKKKQKTPSKDLKIAVERYKKWQISLDR